MSSISPTGPRTGPHEEDAAPPADAPAAAPPPSRAPAALPGRGQVLARLGANAICGPEENACLPFADYDLDGTSEPTAGPEKCLPLDAGELDALSPASRAALDAATADPRVAAELDAVVSHGLYQRLDAGQKAEVLDVFLAADEAGRAALPTLMTRRVVAGDPPDPVLIPALLSADNAPPSSQKSLLDHLSALARTPLSPAAEPHRAEILGSTIEETATPTWSIDQGNVGECVPTTLLTHLVLHGPAEYARLAAGLVSPARSVALADGRTLDAAANDVVPPPRTAGAWGMADPRSLTERVLEGAFQQFGERSSGRAQNVDVTREDGGLYEGEMAAILKSLYDRDYAVEPSDPSLFGTTMEQRPALFERVDAELAAGWGPVPVTMLWGFDGVNVAGKHALTVVDVADGRVFLRNPWGSQENQGAGYVDGQAIAGPPARRVEQAKSGLESMTVEEFTRVLDGVIAGPPVGGGRTER